MAIMAFCAMGRYRAGDRIAARELVDTKGRAIRVPPAGGLLHLQFRRFAGCPVCNLHLQSFARRAAEVEAAGIQEVILFHSTVDELLKYQDDVPFPIVADPDKKLYREFGVEKSWWAVLDPRAWKSGVVGELQSVGRSIRGGRPLLINPRHGRLGLPADFLIAPNGSIVASKYGRHADDQWSVDDVIRTGATVT